MSKISLQDVKTGCSVNNNTGLSNKNARKNFAKAKKNVTVEAFIPYKNSLSLLLNASGLLGLI